MNSGFRLVIRAGPSAGKVFPLDKTELFIGRDLNNDVTINDPEVSRRHARLFMQGANFVIEDLGSTNGTQINGQRIMGPHILRSGELIVFGEHVSLVFESAEPEIDATVASPGSRPSPTQQPQPAYQPPPQAYQPPPPPAYPPPPPPAYRPPAQPFSGQVPASPEVAEPPEKRKLPVGVIVVVIALLVIICACTAFLWFIDANNLWCSWFGFVFGPNACP
ncbi:MAG: FHA domain-containing protein [Anaerolineaceae bacterium]|nr:FHA domain-containing protein [Anaerolineaceae bacterium]